MFPLIEASKQVILKMKLKNDEKNVKQLKGLILLETLLNDKDL